MITPRPPLEFADASELSDEALRAWARLLVHVVQKRGQAEGESRHDHAGEAAAAHIGPVNEGNRDEDE
jgi:hypothetical protein